jgi:5-methylcytosine-specific restriction endonuclease McrA
MSEVLKRCFRLARKELERQKFAQVENPRESTSPTDSRTIPANVQRAVFERDGGRCAFVGEGGHRCGSRFQLEFDHVIPLALGGQSTVDNVRLVCRAHNQFEADRKLGREFMEKKRASEAATRQVASGLRNLGMKAGEAKEFAEATDPEASVDDRLRQALRMVNVRGTVRSTPAAATPEATAEPVPV